MYRALRDPSGEDRYYFTVALHRVGLRGLKLLRHLGWVKHRALVCKNCRKIIADKVVNKSNYHDVVRFFTLLLEEERQNIHQAQGGGGVVCANMGGKQTGKNDRRPILGGDLRLGGHGRFHVCPALFCDPWNPRDPDKNVGRAPRRPATSAGKVAHPVSLAERSLHESPRENGNRQPHVRVAACRLKSGAPNSGCNVADLKHSVTTARA